MTLSYSKSKFLEALLHLRKNGPNEDDEDMGICYNGAQFIGVSGHPEGVDVYSEFYEFVGEYSQSWPKCSGCISYPIPSDRTRYAGYGHKWKDEEGALRYELIDFLIAKLLEEEKQS